MHVHDLSVWACNPSYPARRRAIAVTPVRPMDGPPADGHAHRVVLGVRVERTQAGPCAAEARRVAAALGDGLELRLTGPLPPYSFVRPAGKAAYDAAPWVPAPPVGVPRPVGRHREPGPPDLAENGFAATMP